MRQAELALHRLEAQGGPVCAHCRQQKPADAFPANRHTISRLSSWCRLCHNEATRRWRSRQVDHRIGAPRPEN